MFEIEEPPERRFALALLQTEPEKVEGGSKKRQRWLGLTMSILSFIIQNGLDKKLFLETLGVPNVTRTVVEKKNGN